MKRQGKWTQLATSFALLLVLVGIFAVAYSGSALTAGVGVEQQPIYHGNPDKRQVSLMINVYWGTEYLDDMLKTLSDYGVKATFFVGGSWAEKNEESLRKIAEGGHEIGNHGYLHRDHKKLSEKENRDEILVCEKMIQSIIDQKTVLFAPPSGSFSKTTLRVASDLGYQTIMWSKDTIDWRDKDESLVFQRATRDLKGGDLVLMHPTEHTKSALARILDYYRDNQFEVVTVSENLQTDV